MLAAVDTQRIAATAHNLVTHTRQVANTTTTDQHDRVFLAVMAFTWDVYGYFLGVGQTHAGDLRRAELGFLGVNRTHLQANALLLRALVQNDRLGGLALNDAVLAYELIYVGINSIC